jgi:hypothetical protein
VSKRDILEARGKKKNKKEWEKMSTWEQAEVSIDQFIDYKRELKDQIAYSAQLIQEYGDKIDYYMRKYPRGKCSISSTSQTLLSSLDLLVLFSTINAC